MQVNDVVCWQSDTAHFCEVVSDEGGGTQLFRAETAEGLIEALGTAQWNATKKIRSLNQALKEQRALLQTVQTFLQTLRDCKSLPNAVRVSVENVELMLTDYLQG